jgi:hypothetical protein
MQIRRIASIIAAALVLACQAWPAHAQFGAFPVNLPKDDFTWNWGDLERSKNRRFADLNATGGEAGFRCTLEGKLSAGSHMTPSDIRQLQNDLGSSLYFIEAATNAMNTLDYQRELDWAILDCDKPEGTADPAKTQASLDKAKAKAVKKLIERREKREREAAKERENAADETDE